MRVVHVLGPLRPSGAEKMLQIAGPSFSDQGITSEIISIGSDVDQFGPALEQAGYVVHHLPMSKTARWVAEFRRRLNALDPDLVHVHAEAGSFWTGAAAHSLRLPVVRTVHNNFEYTGRLRAIRTAQRQLARLAGTTFVAVGSSVQANEWDRFRLPTELIENWIDVDALHPIDQPADHTPDGVRPPDDAKDPLTTFITVGNCADYKNHDALLEAFGLLRGSRIRLLHVGMSEETEAEKRWLADNDLGDVVEFLDHRSDIPDLLAFSDAFVMTSKREGLPLAGIEALCAGLPAVFSDVPGLRDFRSLNGPSIVYVGLTPASIADGLRQIAERRDHFRAAGRQTAVSARRRWSPQTGIPKYLSLYERCGLSGRGDNSRG